MIPATRKARRPGVLKPSYTPDVITPERRRAWRAKQAELELLNAQRPRFPWRETRAA